MLVFEDSMKKKKGENIGKLPFEDSLSEFFFYTSFYLQTR